MLPECDVETVIRDYNAELHAKKYEAERSDAEGKPENFKYDVVYCAARCGLRQGAYIGIQYAAKL